MPKNLLIYLLEKYPNKNWDIIGLSKNHNITYDFVEKNKINFGLGIFYHVIKI